MTDQCMLSQWAHCATELIYFIFLSELISVTWKKFVEDWTAFLAVTFNPCKYITTSLPNLLLPFTLCTIFKNKLPQGRPLESLLLLGCWSKTHLQTVVLSITADSDAEQNWFFDTDDPQSNSAVHAALTLA